MLHLRVLSATAHRAEDAAEDDAGAAVVWDELIAPAREVPTPKVTFVLFLTLACLTTRDARSFTL